LNRFTWLFVLLKVSTDEGWACVCGGGAAGFFAAVVRGREVVRATGGACIVTFTHSLPFSSDSDSLDSWAKSLEVPKQNSVMKIVFFMS